MVTVKAVTLKTVNGYAQDAIRNRIWLNSERKKNEEVQTRRMRTKKNEGVQTGRMRTKKFAEWRRCYRINGLGKL